MKRLLLIELDKALHNFWFIVSTGIGVVLACCSAFLCVQTQMTSGGLVMSQTEWLGLGATGAFNAWLPTAVGDGFVSDLFFLLSPLLMVIPYAWSMRSEMIHGSLSQQCVRATRSQVIRARYCAVFISGALVMFVSLLINFVILLCCIPASVPEVSSNLYIGLQEMDMWSWLFFTYPWAYVLAVLCFDSILAGLWAGLVLAISTLIDNRVVLLVGSFLLSVGFALLNSYGFSLMRMNGFAFNLTDLLHRANGGFVRTPLGVIAFVLPVIVVSACLLFLQKRRDLL